MCAPSSLGREANRAGGPPCKDCEAVSCHTRLAARVSKEEGSELVHPGILSVDPLMSPLLEQFGLT